MGDEMKKIIEFVFGIFSGLLSMKFGREILVFIISLMPVLELRGGILAASLLKVQPLTGYIVSIVGNVIPVPIILLFIRKILDWMNNCNIQFFNKIANWLNKKVDKNKKNIEKYGYLGLLLFVGIPLPGTGAWTGCLIAAVLNLDRKKSFFTILAGIVMASVIMMAILYGIISNLL